MNLKKSIKTISYLKSNAAKMLDEVCENKTTYVITKNGEAKAILQDIEEYDKLQNAITLMKILSLSKLQIEKGEYKELDAAFSEIKKHIKSRKSEKI